MSDKTLYDFENQDMTDYKSIERQALRKASELNDKLIDVKTLLEEVGKANKDLAARAEKDVEFAEYFKK